jgi:hypothetical protein
MISRAVSHFPQPLGKNRMNLRHFVYASVGCLALVAGQLSADDAAGKKTCADKAACSGGSCPATEAAMAKLPSMTYLVGEESVCCEKSAESLAKESNAAIQYVVGDEKFDSKNKAFETLVAKTEAMVEEFTTPQTCSVSGETTIAGKACHCPVEAGAITEKVKSATQLVSMTYKVGEETCSCPNKAKAIAEKAGAKPTFVVDGTETQCEMTARLNLARAKYKAAVMALASNTEAESTESDS